MIFQCNRCLKFFSYKTNYLNHLRRKIPCKESIQKNIDQIDSLKMEENQILFETVKNTASEKFTLLETVLEDNNKIDKKLYTNFKNSKTNGYKCQICNIVYKHTQSLTNHKKTKHKNYDLELSKINEKSSFVCDNDEIEELKKIFIKESLENKQK
jgi:hypothetical protein